jgi:integrase
MKHQYFGDINDFLKYALLRTIGQASGLRLAVCWMLTPDDGRSDGGKTTYLDTPATWRHYDPELFDLLNDAVSRGPRNISVAETGNMLPGAVYHADILQDDLRSRRQYFDRLEGRAAVSDLVFFDPDNGMEVKSKPKGRKGSAKYLHWEEAKRFSALGKSLIVFQHFARVERGAFIAALRQRFEKECGVGWVGALRTSNVAYFVVPAVAHEAELQAACAAVGRRWYPQVQPM